jgi:hypothetical protein
VESAYLTSNIRPHKRGLDAFPPVVEMLRVAEFTTPKRASEARPSLRNIDDEGMAV